MKYCPRCGARNADDALECIKCKGAIPNRNVAVADGHKEIPFAVRERSEVKEVTPSAAESTSAEHSATPSVPHEAKRGVFKKFFDWLNSYVGNTGPAELNWRSLFSAVVFPHTCDQAEDIFMVGTASTTPDPKTVSDTWPKPWLYSRVMLWALLTYGLLYFMVSMFGASLVYPGFVVVGSFVAPIGILVLFVELNVWRNISFYRVMGMFFIGGCSSLVATLVLSVLRSAEPSAEISYISACCIGFTEEIAKAIIVLLYMKYSLRSPQRILNGMLVGAAVGAGFAAFESAGYAFRGIEIQAALLRALVGAITQNDGTAVQAIVANLENLNVIEFANEHIIGRGLLSPGGHVAWAAISGVAFSIIARTEHLKAAALWDGRFWRLALIPVILHAIWDMPFELPFYMKYIGLILGAWMVLLFLVNRGLSEVKRET